MSALHDSAASRSAASWIPGALAALLATALCASALLEIALLRLHAPLVNPREASLLFAYLLLFHLALLAPAALGTAVALAVSGALRARVPTRAEAFLHVAAVGFTWLLVVNAILRFTVSYAPFRGGYKTYATPLGLVNLLVFPCALAVVFALCSLFSESGRHVGHRTRRAALLLGTYLSVFAVTLGINLEAERPLRPDISDLAATPAASAPPARPDRVFVLGIDGLSWHVIKALLAKGELPNFSALVEQGARADFETIIPTYSPVVWNVIATGRGEDAHGIRGFTRFRLPGMKAYLEAAPLVSSINWVNGLNRALSAAAGRGWVEQSPVFNVERRVPALWDIADHFGVTAGVHNWIGTWPATELSPGSFMASGPEDRPGAWRPEQAIRRVLAAQRSEKRDEGPGTPGCPGLLPDTREGVSLYRRFQPRLGLTWTTVDQVHHRYWRGALDYDRIIWPWRVSHSRFAPEIVQCYRDADAVVGLWRDAIGPQSLLIIVSDHGYSFNGYEHHFAPEGVFLAAGPGVVPGELLDSVTVYDLAPTVLRALSLPLSKELEGRVVEEMFEPGALPEAQLVAGYPWYQSQELHAERSLELEKKELEALKELGYVN